MVVSLKLGLLQKHEEEFIGAARSTVIIIVSSVAHGLNTLQSFPFLFFDTVMASYKANFTYVLHNTKKLPKIVAELKRNIPSSQTIVAIFLVLIIF